MSWWKEWLAGLRGMLILGSSLSSLDYPWISPRLAVAGKYFQIQECIPGLTQLLTFPDRPFNFPHLPPLIHSYACSFSPSCLKKLPLKLWARQASSRVHCSAPKKNPLTKLTCKFLPWSLRAACSQQHPLHRNAICNLSTTGCSAGFWPSILLHSTNLTGFDPDFGMTGYQE